jgi:hypothetical protein
VKVGSHTFRTRTAEASSTKAANLAAAQRRHRCIPEVKTEVTKRPTKIADPALRSQILTSLLKGKPDSGYTVDPRAEMTSAAGGKRKSKKEIEWEKFVKESAQYGRYARTKRRKKRSRRR